AFDQVVDPQHNFGVNRLRAKPAIIPFEIKRYRLCAGLLIAFVYELAPAVLPIRGCLFFLVFVF
ncbi:hypothetical protein QWW13_10115, partial [Neisseria gonorrhoeae]